MAQRDDDDYLSGDDEEINEYEMPEPDAERELDTVYLSAAASKGLTFTGEKEFAEALNNIKDLAHEDFFQNGDREKVNDMGILTEYINFLALINQAIDYVFSTKVPINNMFAGEIGDKLKEGLKLFFDIVLTQSHIPLNSEQTNYRNKLIKANLVDFPYCHRKECLSMD
jgi:hypothetical protein